MTAHTIYEPCAWIALTGTFRFVGVADIASVRFSLPAQLLEPTPNLGTTVDNWGICGCWLITRILELFGSTGDFCEVWLDDGLRIINILMRLKYWYIRWRPRSYAGGFAILVHKGFGMRLDQTMQLIYYTNIMYRNTSRASHASHTTRRWENFLGFVS